MAQTDKQTDRQTDIATLRLNWPSEKRRKKQNHMKSKTYFLMKIIGLTIQTRWSI